jgi:hypothetical protein
VGENAESKSAGLASNIEASPFPFLAPSSLQSTGSNFWISTEWVLV